MAVIEVKDPDFSGELEGNSRLVVKYYASWCGSCRLLAPKFRRMSEDPSNEGIRFLEIDAENNPEARKKAGVSNLPFVATFLNGTLIEGYPTSKEEAILGMIEKLNS
jgi:thioredoxin